MACVCHMRQCVNWNIDLVTYRHLVFTIGPSLIFYTSSHKDPKVGRTWCAGAQYLFIYNTAQPGCIYYEYKYLHKYTDTGSA